MLRGTAARIGSYDSPTTNVSWPASEASKHKEVSLVVQIAPIHLSSLLTHTLGTLNLSPLLQHQQAAAAAHSFSFAHVEAMRKHNTGHEREETQTEMN